MADKGYQENSASVSSSSARTELLKEGKYKGMLFKDRYLIEGKLGEGGVCEVYLALDKHLHAKPVVVKVLLDESSRDEWFNKKLKQEVEALSRIDHPGVVGVLDSGQTPDAKQFLVMQYIKGRTLRSLIKDNGMDFQRVATIMRQIGPALTAAHEKGVLHCDLKPENIMLQDLGEAEYQIKIVDFGIAKLRDSTISQTLSETRVAGTLPYMSPEQVEGKPQVATDIFALGVIAYEMLTGCRPFKPANRYQVLEALRQGVRVKPTDLRPSLSSAAQTIILKALSFDSRNRYARARDFAELLAQALTTDFEKPAGVREEEGSDFELAHVVFMDIVGYSKLPTDEQTKAYKQLQQVVCGTETFQRAKAARQLVSRSTGDGMALVFFSGPKDPVECAIEIARAIRSLPQIKLRTGINSGPVYRVKDVNETEDVAGSGINMAQRVMDCGDSGHILLSKSLAEILTELGEWRTRIHDLGERKVKHGVRVHLYSLQFGEIGNPRLPEKISKQRKSQGAAVAVGLMILLAAAAAAWMIGRSNAPDNNSASNVNSSGVTSAPIVRVVTYSLTIQETSSRGAAGKPQQIPDADPGANFKGRDVKLNFSAAQGGYLYVLNELSGAVNGPPTYKVIYPSSTDKQQGKISRVTIPEDEDEWFSPLGREGTTRLWLVWSDNKVDEIEDVESQANKGGGKIEDPAQNKAVQDMLAKFVASKTHSQRDDAKRQTDVMWKSPTLAYELILKYK